jgi:hypothetical protein
MDIKAKIEEIIAKVKGDDSLKEKFMSDPAGTVKGLVGDAADDDTVKKIIDAVKDALASGGIAGIKDKIADAVGGLFGKKGDEEKKD